MAIITTKVSGTTTSNIFQARGQNAVTTMIFCNTDSITNTTISVFVVPNNGANPGGVNAGAGTQILNNISIPATETFMFDTEKLILEDGDAIFAQATNDQIITATVSSIVTQ